MVGAPAARAQGRYLQGNRRRDRRRTTSHHDERRRGDRLRLHDGAAEQQGRLRHHLREGRKALWQEGRRRYRRYQRLLHVPRPAAQHGTPAGFRRRAVSAALPELRARGDSRMTRSWVLAPIVFAGIAERAKAETWLNDLELMAERSSGICAGFATERWKLDFSGTTLT